MAGRDGDVFRRGGRIRLARRRLCRPQAQLHQDVVRRYAARRRRLDQGKAGEEEGGLTPQGSVRPTFIQDNLAMIVRSASPKRWISSTVL